MVEAAPVVEAAPAAEASASSEPQGYAISVSGQDGEYTIIAANISEAATASIAALAAKGVSGAVSAIRHLGPALI